MHSHKIHLFFAVQQLAEKIATEYGRRDLLKLGAKPVNPFDPPCVLGVSS